MRLSLPADTSIIKSLLNIDQTQIHITDSDFTQPTRFFGMSRYMHMCIYCGRFVNTSKPISLFNMAADWNRNSRPHRSVPTTLQSSVRLSMLRWRTHLLLHQKRFAACWHWETAAETLKPSCSRWRRCSPLKTQQKQHPKRFRRFRQTPTTRRCGENTCTR